MSRRTSNAASTDSRRRSRPARRGFAVIVALVAVATASILGLALAGSRDANAAAGANLEEASASRVATASAIDLAGAMLADPALLREGNTLFSGLEIDGHTVAVTAIDLETGAAASEDAQAIELVATARSERASRVARAIGRAGGARARVEADLDGSEFAVLGTTRVTIESDAHVGAWPASPLAALHEPIRLGVASGDASRVAIDGQARVHGCVRLVRGAFPTDSLDADEALARGQCRVPEQIHVPAAETPKAPQGAAVSSLSIDGLVTRDAHSTGDARVPARGTATLRGDLEIDIGGSLVVERGARLIVEGPTRIVVRKNLVLDACAIEVARGGSLAIHALGDATIDASYAGGWREDPSEGRDASGDAGYDGGSRALAIFVAGSGRVVLSEGSVLKGELYAPAARIDVQSRSAVYGRLLGGEIALRSGTAVFYDPALDMRRGWSNRDSGLWTDSGALRPGVREVATLDDESLVGFVRAAGVLAESPSRAQEKLAIARGKPTPAAFTQAIRGRKDPLSGKELDEIAGAAGFEAFVILEEGDR